MARFSIGGDDDDDDESVEDLNRRRLSKRIRTVGPSSPAMTTVGSPHSGDSSVGPPSEVEQDSNEQDPYRFSSPDYTRTAGVYEREDYVAYDVDDDESPCRNSTFSDFGSDRESGRPVSVTLEDLDVLDCPICLEPLAPPVYQCENGHIACSSCCTTMTNKCGSCCLPIGYNRCRAMEKVLESVKVPCQNSGRGCWKRISYSEKLDHEKTCDYSPCSCPHPNCDYTNSSKNVYKHFHRKHVAKEFKWDVPFTISLEEYETYIFLQEKTHDTLFYLDRAADDTLGSFVSIVCVAPTFSEVLYSYDIIARSGASSLRLTTNAKNVPDWTVSVSEKAFFLVPNDFVDLRGRLRLELKIHPPPELSDS